MPDEKKRGGVQASRFTTFLARTASLLLVNGGLGKALGFEPKTTGGVFLELLELSWGRQFFYQL